MLKRCTDDNKLYSSENVRMCRRNTCWDKGKPQRQRKKLELVNSTSRRGARVEYHDEYPRDFGRRIAYTVSLVSDTPIRQGRRDILAPRPFEIYSFHPPALFSDLFLDQFLYIYETVPFIVTMWFFTLYICNLRMRSSNTI